LKKVKCSVNPLTGNERRLTLAPAPKKRRIVVIGGGPGGMEAARVAALRGHEVTLVEKGSHLGGKLVPASSPSFKEDLRSFIDHGTKQIEKRGVTVLLNQKGSVEAIKKLAPDVVILATGADQTVPDIRGASEGNVFTSLEVLGGHAALKGARVVVIGGGTVGCETALFLAQAGKDTTIVEMLDAILVEEKNDLNKIGLMAMLKESQIRILTGCLVDEITPEGVYVKQEGETRKRLEADSVVLSTGFVSNTEGHEELRRAFQEVYVVGDCVEPRKVFEAVQEAAVIANSL
jgi:NADPH-dependent 2,4-dienoyl-CoA reductase/sulfur reductase-like enzyme